MSLRKVVLCCLVPAVAAGCGSDPSKASSQEGTENVAAVRPAVAGCGSSYCPTNTAANDFGGQWPDGIVYYKFDSTTTPAWQADVRNAMSDWERMAGQAIRFCPTGVPTPPA